MKLGRHTEAQAVLDAELHTYLGKEVLEDLLAMQQATKGDWRLLNEADKSTLWAHAEAGRTGAAQAAAILLSLNAEAPLPPVRFPNLNKSRVLGSSGISAIAPIAEQTLGCFPNPSSTNTFLTYPGELDGNQVVLYDAKGALVHALLLNGNGLLEVDTRNLDAGLYSVAIAGTSLHTKLNVQR